MKKMKAIAIGMVLFLMSLPIGAQEEREMRWENMTALTFAATNGTDKENALQQYLLFDEQVLDRNQDLLEQYRTFAEEFFQMNLNADAPQMNKEIDESIAQIKKMMKEHPELAEELKEQLKGVEAMRGELNGHVDKKVTKYTYDPKDILRRLTNIAVGKRAYTGHRDIGNGLFAVKTGACYGPLEPDAFKRVKTSEKNEHTWGAIDYEGKFVIEPKYGTFSNSWVDADFIYFETKDKSGVVRTGALGYDGRVRIPFIYDYDVSIGVESDICFLCKNGKIGAVTMDNKPLLPFEYAKIKGWLKNVWEVSKDGKNYGIMDGNMKIAVPMKYVGIWDSNDDCLEMQRFDKMIDVYDIKTFKLLRSKPKPE